MSWFAGAVVSLGVELYSAWRAAAASISWAGYASNASLLGFATRAMPASAGVIWVLGSAIVLSGTVVASRRTRDEALAWTVALAAALLVSPLGWTYYAWILAPSLLSLKRWPWGMKAGLALLWLPPALLPQSTTASLGLLALWGALAAGAAPQTLKRRIPA